MSKQVVNDRITNGNHGEQTKLHVVTKMSTAVTYVDSIINDMWNAKPADTILSNVMI